MSARALAGVGLACWLVATLLRAPGGPVSPAQPVPEAAVSAAAFGALGPILADLLWLRAAAQQEAGQYHAMAETLRRIGRVQPNATALAIFEAQNSAFTIAPQFADPTQRWYWIQHGLRRLLDPAATSPAAAEALATIFLVRMGDLGDAQTVADRVHWANLWQSAVVRRSDGRFGLPDRLAPEPWQRWRMSTAKVLAVEAEYGPLDWRLPEAHAVYWASQALRLAGGVVRRPVAARLRWQALQALFRGGRMVFEPSTGRLELLPNLAALGPLLREMDRLAAVVPDAGELAAARASLAGDAVLVCYLEDRTPATVPGLDRLLGAAAGDDWAALLPVVLTAAGWSAELPADEQAELLIGWLDTARRLRSIGVMDLARGWERLVQAACDRAGGRVPGYEELVNRFLREGGG